MIRIMDRDKVDPDLVKHLSKIFKTSDRVDLFLDQSLSE